MEDSVHKTKGETQSSVLGKQPATFWLDFCPFPHDETHFWYHFRDPNLWLSKTEVLRERLLFLFLETQIVSSGHLNTYLYTQRLLYFQTVSREASLYSIQWLKHRPITNVQRIREHGLLSPTKDIYTTSFQALSPLNIKEGISKGL